jgi:uncharacterized protein (TIGR02118 family)
MYKVAWLARFPDGLGRDEARKRWRDKHGPMCLEVPGVERYVQNQVLNPIGVEGVTEGETGFDGYSCGTWADFESYRAAMSSREWKALVEDGVNIFDMNWLWGMSAELDEVVQKALPAEWEGTDRGKFKVVWVVKFRADMPSDEAHEYWTSNHGPLALKIPGIGDGAYTQNHAVKAIGADGLPTDEIELGFDGFSECWFEDRAKFDAAMLTQEWLDLCDDGAKLFDMDFLWLGMSGVLEERVMRWNAAVGDPAAA